MGAGYYTITKITDFGPYVTKVILPLDFEIANHNLPEGAFSVYVERLDKKGNVIEVPKSWMAPDDKEPSKGYIPVMEAFTCDLDGEKKEVGEYIALCMRYGPTCQLSASITAVGGFNVYLYSRYVITQTKTIEDEHELIQGKVYDFCLENREVDSYGFLNSISQYRECPLRYGYFIPQYKGEKHPLLIWLHGGGEGGVEPTIAYTGNKVTNLITPKIQDMFQGAYVLAPQTTTFWLNDGTGTYGDTGKTIYGTALMELIKEFLSFNSGIDLDRIYIGGDSNGGFMTMRMIVDYPDFFAAAFPVCEGLYDRRISDENIEQIKHLPIWFTHAKNDTILPPEETVLPTYHRLIKAGAADVHLTLWDRITDIHEGFQNDKMEPYEYMGHFSWIPMLNDDCHLDYDGSSVTFQGQDVTLLQWLSKQKRTI
ncbi:MAG: prolyl oligopeptidase family serine peptidase [Lachnospiraceae bacterium]